MESETKGINLNDVETQEPKSPETDLLPKIEDIQQSGEELKARVADAKKQKEKDIEQKILEREQLIAELKSNDELIEAATSTMEHYSSLQEELGQLDEADLGKFEELKSQLLLLESRRLEIGKIINAYSSSPQIFEKLYDIAEKEGTRREIRNLVEKCHVELDPQILKIAMEIKNLASRRNVLGKSISENEQTVSNSWEEIKKVFNSAVNMLSDKSDFSNELQQILKNAGSSEEIIQMLSEKRKSLGIFKRKEKSAVDFILTQNKIFDKYTSDKEHLLAARQQQDSTKEEESNITEKFKAAIEKAWETQNEISKVSGISSWKDLPYDLWSGLELQMKKIADVEHWEGGRKVGKHEGWHSATRDSKTDTMYHMWKNIEKNSGGYGLVMNNPKKTEAV